MKRKTIMILILSFAIAGACATAAIANRERLSQYLFGDSAEIINGFSDELSDGLNTQYGIKIPEKAVFIKGLNTNSFRDPCIVILFSCSINESACVADMDTYVRELLNLDQERYSMAGSEDIIAADWYEEYGGKFDRMISAPDDVFTCISYKTSGNQLLIRFVGHHPHATFS